MLGEIADTYIGMWKTAVDSGKPLTKINAQGKPIKLGVTNDLAKKYGLKQGEDILATDKYIPTQYDLTTYEGFKVLQREHPLIAMGFERYNNSRGQQAGRLIEGRAEYDHQILGWSNDKVKKVNNSGGLRIFSFSDFEAVHLLDLVQIIIDCSARGVKIQGYTKVPAFAKLIRNTGIKLNRSLIPKGNTGIKVVNGKEVLDIDTTEGIDINDKDFMDEADNPNIGNILIGINPKQISIAMLDDFVDYIIPFHTNKSNAVCKKLGVGEWVNYKESQHEKDIATGKASAKNVNIYTEVINKYNPTNKVEFVNAFLEECRAQKKIPRYAEFLNKEYKADGIYSDEYGRFDYTYREGYHKFPIDFKMFDKQGNILLQENIVPNLDEGFMKEILDREVDRKKNYTFPEEVYNEIEQKFGKQYDQTVANDIIDEGDDGIEQFSLRHIIDKNGKDYGIGVYLDSELLSNLTEDERVELVKEYIKELGGQEFTAYDKNGKEFNVKIAEHKRTFVNNKGKRRFVNNDLSTKHILNRIKQESIVLVDELVLTSSYDSSTTALYPHGWVDNYGKNKWEYLISYVQDKNNSIWQLTLNIANSESGEKILYDINKIKAMGRSVDIGSVPTASGQTKNAQVDNSLPQNPDSVNTQNDKNLEQEQKRTPKELDADYMDAVNRGDMETAQKMVDEAAKEAGYKIKAYHGTNADFTVFDKKRVGKGIDQYGAGFYFASNPDVTEHYGTKRYDTYLKITKPINLITRPRGNGKTLNDVKLNQTQSYQILKRHPLMYDKENSPLGDFYEEYWEAGAKEWMIKDLAKKYNTVGELDGDVILYRDYPNELHEAIRDVVGYDGVQIYFETDSMVDERNDYYYVTWFNNQIKSADPIVYDDNGNVVPLSERFNSNNDDIRYQLRSSPLTDREVLSMAVERIDEEKLTTAEKNALDIFKKKLAKLNRIHSEREKQGSLYKEQQFGKDGDRKEAVKTLNRMKILDEQIKRATAELLSIKDKETLKNVLQNARKVVEVEQRAHDREVVARAKERQEITATKNKYKAIIRTDVDELVKWVTKPDNKAHKQVPDAVKNSVIAMLSSIDTSSDKLYKGQPTKATRKFLENTEKLKNALKTDFNAETAYSAYFDLPSDFMTRLDAFIEEGRKLAQASEGGFDVKSMNVEQLEQLAKIVRELKTWIKNINKFHDNAMFKFASDAGDNTIDTLAKMSDAGKHTGKAYKWFEFDQVRPSVVWERFGKGGKAIEQGFIDGQAKLAFNTKAVIDFRSKTYTEKEVKKWTNTINTVKLNGKTIEMPTSYLMGLYLLSKQKDSVRHLLGGGFRVGTFIREGKKYYDNEQHSFANEKQLNEFLDEYFSADKFAREREVADKIQKYMATTGAEWGNYVSVARFGEEKFTNPEYYPINSDGRLFEANTDEKPNNVDLYALLNMSFTKTRQEEANNKIIVYDMFDVFANHMSSMAQYNAFALPILNALKWLNYKQTELVGGKVATLDTVRDELARVYGTPEESGKGGGKTSYAETFIKNIIKAYNGTEVQGIATDELGMKGLRRHNMAQIAYNFRVVAQQPLSIIRAGTVLDMKNITKASGKILASINTTREEMLKHNGTAVWKNLGFYDINITRNMSEIIKGTQTTLDKIGEVGMKGAETMDILTWTTLWNACKLEVEQKQKITQADGELYWEKVNLLFNETIYKTQVVDTVLTKSEFMRSKGFFARAVSSFMSEPVTAYSTFVEAFDRYTRDIKSGYSKSEAWKRNGKHIGRTTAMYCLNAIMLSAVTAVIDSARDDDEYEEFGEKWAENFAENVIDELMPFNKLPIFSDLYDIAKELLSKVGVDTYGNPPQTLFAQWYDSLGKGVEILYDKISGEDTNYTYYGGIYKLLQAVSSMVGLPIAPLTRTVVTAWNSTVGELVPKYKIKSYDSGEFNSIKYAFKDGKLTEAEAIKELLSQGLIEDTTIGKNNEAYFIIREWEYGEGYSRYAKLYDSAINGNGNYSQALKELTSHGYDEKRIRTTLQTELSKRFKAGEVSKTTALTVLTKYCGKSRTEAEKLVYGWENA